MITIIFNAARHMAQALKMSTRHFLYALSSEKGDHSILALIKLRVSSKNVIMLFSFTVTYD
jgi:hypothetical protein